VFTSSQKEPSPGECDCMLQLVAITSVRHSYRIQFDLCLMGCNCLRLLLFLQADVCTDYHHDIQTQESVNFLINQYSTFRKKILARISQQKEDRFSTVHQAHYYIAHFLVFGGLLHQSLKLLFDLVLHHDLSELSVLRALNTFVTTCNSINLRPRVVLLVLLSFRTDSIDSLGPRYLDER
jgi:hypothetical protein